MSESCSKIWVVDDDPDDLYLIQTAFAQSRPNLTIQTLNDGAELLPQLRVSPAPPELVLLDLNMPLLNGFDTLKQVRSTEQWKHLPIIVFTTSSSESDRVKCLALGATDFISKPGGFKELNVLVEHLSQQWQLSS